MISSEDTANKGLVINIGIFGTTNSGKCSLLKRLTIDYGNIADPYNFRHKGICFHSFPIPCTQPDYQENYDMSMNNSDFVLLIVNPFEEGEVKRDFYAAIIRDAYLHALQKLIVCFNKSDLGQSTKEEEITKVITESDQQTKALYSLNLLEIAYVHISANEGTGFDKLLSQLSTTPACSKDDSIGEQGKVVMTVHEAYEDTEDGLMVVSGKVIQGAAITLGTEVLNSLKPVTICNCFGDEVHSVKKREFITLKFDLKQFTSQCQGFNKNSLITSAQLALPRFKLFESVLLFTSLPCSVISQGFQAMFASGAIRQECLIEKITKEAPALPGKVKSFVVPELNVLFKARIKLKEDVNREKYENIPRLGAFTLLLEGK